MAGLLLWIIKCIKVGFEEVRKGFLSQKTFHVAGRKTEPAQEPAVESPFT